MRPRRKDSKLVFCHPGDDIGYRIDREHAQGSLTAGVFEDLSKLWEKSVQ